MQGNSTDKVQDTNTQDNTKDTNTQEATPEDKKLKKKLAKLAKKEKFFAKAKSSSTGTTSSTTHTTSSSTTKPTSGFDPKEIEEKWFRVWESQGLFRPRPGGEKFVITMPPPNITGSLHIGHSMMVAIQDCLVRYKRMKGCEVLYLPGTDHAGIATQSVVSKKIGRVVSREEFLEEAWKWKEKYGGRIVEQFKRLGASADFSQSKFTMDKEMSEAVTEAFVRLHEKGLIYRESKIVNWSSKLKTTLSDLEVDHLVVKPSSVLEVDGGKYEFGVIYQIKYPLCSDGGSDTASATGHTQYVEVQTTRPETIVGDVALCAHPEDPRYKGLPSPLNPLTGEKILFVYDHQADKEFGTGLLKVTPAHDPVDFEIGKRHSLRMVPIFDSENRVCVPGPLYGLKRYEARIKALEILREKGLLVQKIPYEQTIPICSRSGDIVEPIIKEQWWCRTKGMAEKALGATRRKEIEIHPPEAEKTWERWLGGIRDWCLSRQLWWGHRIPAYKSPCGLWAIGRSKEEAVRIFNSQYKTEYLAEDFSQDEDVLDTWFSSGLWPFATMGWPGCLSNYFPSSLLETGSDILFFWVARMVMLSLELTDSIPFPRILLHGIVRDAHGRKMSKSLGNVIDPLFVIEGIDLDSLVSTMKKGNLPLSEVKKAEKGLRRDFPRGIPKCGADALRFTLLSYTLGMKDINLDILRVEGYRRLCNKLWNAHQYLKIRMGSSISSGSPFDMSEIATHLPSSSIHSKLAAIRWLLSRRDETIRSSEASLAIYNFLSATQVIHQFFLYDFCDVYIEISKGATHPLYSQYLLSVFLDILRIFHPYLPFITEEIYSHYSKDSIMYSPYPTPLGIEDDSSFSSLLAFVKLLRSKKPSTIRILRSTYSLDDSYLTSLIKKTTIEYVDELHGEYLKDFGFIYQLE